jgi:hypothetical protein
MGDNGGIMENATERLAELEKAGGYVIGAASRIRENLGFPERKVEDSISVILKNREFEKGGQVNLDSDRVGRDIKRDKIESLTGQSGPQPKNKKAK